MGDSKFKVNNFSLTQKQEQLLENCLEKESAQSSFDPSETSLDSAVFEI